VEGSSEQQEVLAKVGDDTPPSSNASRDPLDRRGVAGVPEEPVDGDDPLRPIPAEPVSGPHVDATDERAIAVVVTPVDSPEATVSAPSSSAASHDAGNEDAPTRGVAVPESQERAALRLPSVVISEVQTSVAPVVASDAAPPKHRSKLWMYVAAAALVVGAIWGVAGAKRARSPHHPNREVAAVQIAPRAVEKVAAPVMPEPASSSGSALSASPEGAPAPTHEPERPAVADATAETAEPEVTKVRLEVVPTDSKVALYGKVVEGPLVFDVKKGTRTILEIARPGYVTRRIVLNGKKTFMRIMMTPLPKPEGGAETGATSGTTATQ
jgi:hypothetical protein